VAVYCRQLALRRPPKAVTVPSPHTYTYTIAHPLPLGVIATAGVSYLWMTGSTAQQDREAIVKKFETIMSVSVFLLTTQVSNLSHSHFLCSSEGIFLLPKYVINLCPHVGQYIVGYTDPSVVVTGTLCGVLPRINNSTPAHHHTIPLRIVHLPAHS
jgi:hypothetical protein